MFSCFCYVVFARQFRLSASFTNISHCVFLMLLGWVTDYYIPSYISCANILAASYVTPGIAFYYDLAFYNHCYLASLNTNCNMNNSSSQTSLISFDSANDLFLCQSRFLYSSIASIAILYTLCLPLPA